MSKLLKTTVVLIEQITSVFVTAAYLYFILLPIKYLLSIALGNWGLPQEIALWLHIVTIIVLVILGQIHCYKWYIRTNTLETKCDKCGKKTLATNNEPFRLSIEVDPFWGWHMLQSIYQEQLYRPRLHYTCEDCGHEEYICPYCNEPIGKDDKRCPHCKKKIYWIASGLKIA